MAGRAPRRCSQPKATRFVADLLAQFEFLATIISVVTRSFEIVGWLHASRSRALRNSGRQPAGLTHRR
jgi:hypothetical protein